MGQIEVVEIAPGSFAMIGMGQYQGHDPDCEGFLPMSYERAEAVAESMRLLFASLFAS